MPSWFDEKEKLRKWKRDFQQELGRKRTEKQEKRAERRKKRVGNMSHRELNDLMGVNMQTLRRHQGKLKH